MNRAGRRRAVPFWIVAYVFTAVMLGTTVPTPLYVIYQAEWHFRAGTITAIFGSYALAVALTLAFAGRASDRTGRRPVLVAAIGSSLGSTACFLGAGGVPALFAGRFLSGVSSGLVTGCATAALTDLERPGSARRTAVVATAANLGALGLGPLLAGTLAQLAPAPTRTVFVVYALLLVLAAAGLVAVPETVAQRGRPVLRFGVGVPPNGRRAFAAAAVGLFAAFALQGFFSALSPSFLSSTLHDTDHATAGLLVFLVFTAAAVVQVFFTGLAPRAVMAVGLTAMPVAAALVLVGVSLAALWVFVLAALLIGAGTGLVVMGGLATVNALAAADRRAEVASAYFVFGYVGLALPVIAVGVAADYVGSYRASVGDAMLVCALVLVAAVTLWTSSDRAAPSLNRVTRRA